LGIPEGERIPSDRLEEAARSRDPHMRQMANYAKSAKKWDHSGKGKRRMPPARKKDK
jgi:hypothetical protein